MKAWSKLQSWSCACASFRIYSLLYDAAIPFACGHLVTRFGRHPMCGDTSDNRSVVVVVVAGTL